MNKNETGLAEQTETVIGENVTLENTGKVLEIMTADQVADNEVKKFDLALAWIEQRKKEYSVLIIAGVDDKDGYKAVENAWREIRNKRLAVSNKHKELKADYLVITRKIDGAKNQFTELLEEIENPLKDKLDEIEKIKLEEKNRAERELTERLQARVTELLSNGMKFDGSFYSIGESVSMDVVTLKEMSPENYSRLLGIVQEKHQAELDRLQAEKEAKEKEQAALDQQKKQQEEAERKLADEREALKKERREARTEILISRGLTYDKILGVWEYKSGTEKEQFRAADLGELDGPGWTNLFEQIGDTMRRVDKRAEDKAVEDAAKKLDDEKKKANENLIFLRTSQLKALGFSVDIAGNFTLKNEITNEVYQIDKGELIKISDFDGEISLIKVFIAKMDQDIQEDKKIKAEEAEKLRIANLSEIEKVSELVSKLKVVYEGFVPVVTNKTLQNILNSFQGQIEAAERTLSEIK